MNNFINYKRIASIGIVFLIFLFLILLSIYPILAQSQTLDFQYVVNNQLIHEKDTFSLRSEVMDFEGKKCWLINEKKGNFGSLEIRSETFIPTSFRLRRPWGSYEAEVVGYHKNKKVFSKKFLVTDKFKQMNLKKMQITKLTITSLKNYNQIYVCDFKYVRPKVELSESKKQEIQQEYVLSFEGNQSVFIENNHQFELSSAVSSNFASDSLKSWECAEGQGNRGFLKLKDGKFVITSLKIKRPWGKYKARITGYDGDKKVFTKKVRVGQKFQYIKLRPKQITRLEIESSKKYNPLYVDEIAYLYQQNTINAQNLGIQNSADQDHQTTRQLTTMHQESTITEQSVENQESVYQINFEDVPLSASRFQVNEHFFELHSQVFEGHARSGKRTWQANEEGTFGTLKMKDHDFNLVSLWIKRPWGAFDVNIVGYENGIKKYEKEVLVKDAYQKVTFKDWIKIDEITVRSKKKFNQVYLDDIAYTIYDDLASKNTNENEKKHKSAFVTSQMALTPQYLEFTDRYFGQRFKLPETTHEGVRLAWEIIRGSAQMIGTNEVELTGTDSVKLRVSDESGHSWHTTFGVQKAKQILDIKPVEDVMIGQETVEISATLTSGMKPNIKVVKGAAKVYGDVIILQKKVAGQIKLSLSHQGNQFYHPVEPKIITFNVIRKPQRITFADKNYELDGSPFKIQVVASSKLPVELEIVSGKAKISGKTIHPKNHSTKNNCIVVKALQAGNTEYAPAQEVEKTFCITPRKKKKTLQTTIKQ